MPCGFGLLYLRVPEVFPKSWCRRTGGSDAGEASAVGCQSDQSDLGQKPIPRRRADPQQRSRIPPISASWPCRSIAGGKVGIDRRFKQVQSGPRKARSALLGPSGHAAGMLGAVRPGGARPPLAAAGGMAYLTRFPDSHIDFPREISVVRAPQPALIAQARHGTPWRASAVRQSSTPRRSPRCRP